MSANPVNENTQLQVVQPTPLPAAPRGPRLGLPTRDELAALIEYGGMVAKSGLFPTVKSAEAAVVMMRYGHQLGIDEFTALQNMYLQNGKPTAFASLLHSLILRDHGGDAIRIVEASAERCVLSCARRESPHHRTEVSYTLDEAKAAGLLGKDGPWKLYPKDMLFARCVGRAGRQLYRDSTLGMYTPEELGGTVIEVNGEVIDTALAGGRSEASPAAEPAADPSEDPAEAHRTAMAALHAQARNRATHEQLHDLGVAAYGVPSLTDCDARQLNGLRCVVRDSTLEQFAAVLDVAQSIDTATDRGFLDGVAGQVTTSDLPEMAKRLLMATISRVDARLQAAEARAAAPDPPAPRELDGMPADADRYTA
jgi:hypothetical protein